MKNIKKLEKIRGDMLQMTVDDKNDIITKQFFFSVQSLTDELIKYHNNKRMDKTRIDRELNNLANKLNVCYEYVIEHGS